MQSDRNLLLGILAVQMDFIDRDGLVEGMHEWVLDKSRSLADVLAAGGRLSGERRALLEALVDEHLKGHDGDAAQSLGAVPPAHGLRMRLEAIEDAELRASLAHVVDEGGEEASRDSWRTVPGGAAEVEDEEARYRILRPHAQGGIGEVSVAYDEELKREVALKEIQDQYADHQETRLRFVREAEITGGLEHPGIVPVYGLGHYLDGRPYYAMRFVRGDSLDEAVTRFHAKAWTARNRGERTLELRKLLGRFVDVCDAVEYAHSRGVLHRDLKPGNVMLGRYGETLVVDWGLAKVLDEQDAEAGEAPLAKSGLVGGVKTPAGATPTQQGTTVGTPQYMSPEQAEGRLDLLGKASDVYSLGATLYRVLTGKAPIDDGNVGSVLRRVAAGDFPAPRAVDDQVPRALEAVCLKAMSRDPVDRYPSARALADDVEHWLADEPVSAAQDTMLDRAFRFARHHRRGVQAAAFALVAVTAVSVGAAVMVNAARHEATQQRDAARLAQQEESRLREQAQKDRDLAEAARREADAARSRAVDAEALAVEEARTANSVSSFLVGLFQGPDILGLGGYEFEGGGQGRSDLTAGELLELGAATVDERLAGEPIIRAQLMDTIGVTYLSTGQTRKAAPLLTGALAIRQEELTAPHMDVADSLRHVGMLRFVQGYADAHEMIREARAMRLQLVGEDDRRAVLDEYCLAWSLVEYSTRLEESRSLFRSVLAAREAMDPRDERDVSYAILGLALAEFLNGSSANAMQLVQRAMDTFRDLEPDSSPLEPVLTFAYAVANLTTGNSADGKLGVRETIRKANAIYGERHPALLFLQSEMAWYLDDIGESGLADELLESSVELARESIGDHPRTAVILRLRGSVKHRLGELDSAIALFEEATSLWEIAAPKDPFLGFAYTDFGLVMRDAGDAERAEVLQQKARSLLVDAEDVTRADRAMVDCRLAEVLAERGAFAEAKIHAEGTYETLRDGFGATHRETQRAGRVLVTVYEELGEEANAARYRERGEDDD